MMTWLEQKYIGLISNRLELFKRTKKNEYNFRCPLCGDSRKSKWKARGHLFVKDDGKYLYHCFNCSVTLGLDKFLEQLDPIVFQEFTREKLAESLNPKRIKSKAEIFAEKMKQPTFVKDTPLKKLKKISQLSHNHPAKKYVMDRKIPAHTHSKLFYCPKFVEWTRSIDPDLMRSGDNMRDEPRLIIPFLDADGNLFGFQGRSFKKTGLRYITIMIDKSKPKVFGLDTCDFSKTHYIFEGPIDSLFVKNSIAMAGGSIDYNLVNENTVFVYDNEPRSKETCDKIGKIIDKGCKVVIFPESIKSKDINDMVLEGVNVEDVLRYNISSGLEAKILFTAWKRI